MAMNTLNALEVKNAQPGTKDGRQIPKLYSDGGGLYLRVAPTGKSWVFKFKHAGKPREMGAGSYPTVTLADARERASELRRQVAQGIDPIEQRKASQQQAQRPQVKVQSFAEVATQFIDGRADGWKNPKHVDQWRNTLATYCKSFNTKPIAEVGIDDVEAALRPFWLEKIETATRVLDRIVCVINYATDKQLRSDDAASWPRRLRENRLPMLPKKTERVRHHPALPFVQLPAFMARLRQSPAMGARALEFAILCANRSGEVRNATWSEFDLDAALWVIPASRMKTKTEHRIPLSTQAVELLRALPQGEQSDYVFPGEKQGKPLSDMSMTAFIRRANAKVATWIDEAGETVTQHGFRSSFSTWASETTPFPQAVVEKSLAHSIGNRVEAAYRRGDLFEKRRELMQQWADFCAGK